MKKALLLLFLLPVFSCISQQSVSWQTGQSEALISLPENAKNAKLLLRVSAATATRNTERYVYPGDPSAFSGLQSGFNAELNNRRYLRNTGSLSNFRTINPEIMPDTLSTDQVKSIAGNVDIMVSLDMMALFYEDQYTIEIRKQKVGDLYKELDFIVGKRSITFRSAWRSYDARSGRLLDEYSQDELYSYEGESMERVRTTELLELNFAKEARNLGMRAGAAYASRISPTLHYTYRNIYIRGSYALEEGALKIRDNQWDEAAAIWSKSLKREIKSKNKAKLYHNLAIYEERQGNPEQAKEYAQLAANHHKIGRQTQMVVGY